MPAAILYGLLLAVAGPGADDAPGAAEARALLARQEADWNRGDLDAFLSGYWDSPLVVFQSAGERTRGFAAMKARYERRYKAEGRAMGKLAFTELEYENLAPDCVLARGRWRLTMPDDKTPGGLFTVIVRKTADGWRIVHDHTSSEEAK